MLGRATLTVRGVCHGLDGFDLLLGGLKVDAFEQVAAHLPGWLWLPRRRRLRVGGVADVALRVKGSKSGGTSVCAGAEECRGRPRAELLGWVGDLAQAAAGIGCRLTLPRADWFVQGDVGSADDTIRRALEAGFVSPTQDPDDERMAEVRSGAGRSEYFYLSVSKHLKGKDGTERVVRDEYTLRVYRAYDVDGVVYDRAEVQERIASRQLCLPLRPSPVAAHVLGAPPEEAGPVERCESVAAPREQVARALSLLAQYSPRTALREVAALMELISEETGWAFAGASERMAERRWKEG